MTTLEPQAKFKVGDAITVKEHGMPIEKGEIFKFLLFENGKFWIGVQTATREGFWTDPSNCE